MPVSSGMDLEASPFAVKIQYANLRLHAIDCSPNVGPIVVINDRRATLGRQVQSTVPAILTSSYSNEDDATLSMAMSAAGAHMTCGRRRVSEHVAVVRWYLVGRLNAWVSCLPFPTREHVRDGWRWKIRRGLEGVRPEGRAWGTESLGSQSSRPCGLIAKSCCCAGCSALLRAFRGVSVLAVLVTVYEIIAAAVLRSTL